MRFPLLFKFVAIGAVFMAIGMVLARIGWLVDERGMRQREAEASVEQSHAGAQTLAGPWLQRQCTEEWEVATGEGKERKVTTERRSFTLAAVPAVLDVQGQARSDVRRRGLFRVNSYGAALTLAAEWPSLAALQPERTQPASRLACQAPVLLLALSDVRGVRTAQVSVDGQALAVQPGTGDDRRRGLQAPLAATVLEAGAARPLRARVQLDIAGTGQLAVVPSAEATRYELRSDWPHPSFGGRFLPMAHEIGAAGFSARWAVSSLATSAPADLLRGAPVCPGGAAVPAGGSNVPCLDTLSVAFFDPVNPQVLSDRAIKYGLLFVGLSFVAVALVEVLSGRRVHPVQYGLVGLALSLFFLLLLSLSEHWPFATAYAVAAAACAVLLGHYAMHMLGRALAGLAFGAAIAGLYGLLYVLLQMEQNALVIGSVGLFGAVAAVMVLTRRIDWYQLLDGLRRGAAARPAA